jgi:hypothetical protein
MVSDSTNTTRIMMQNTSDTTVTWADIDTGSEETGTTYYVYAVASGDDDKVQAYVISKSSTAPTGQTYYRRIGNFFNNASGNISQITNDDPVTKSYYDSGWFAISTGSTYTKTHNLNTTNLLCTVYLSSSSTGASEVSIMGDTIVAEQGAYGGLLGSITSTQCTLGTGNVGLGQAGYFGITEISSSGYARIILEVL